MDRQIYELQLAIGPLQFLCRRWVLHFKTADYCVVPSFDSTHECPERLMCGGRRFLRTFLGSFLRQNNRDLHIKLWDISTGQVWNQALEKTMNRLRSGERGAIDNPSSIDFMKHVTISPEQGGGKGRLNLICFWLKVCFAPGSIV